MRPAHGTSAQPPRSPSRHARATPIIIHERTAEWVGRLRPRLADLPALRWVESRSSADLVAAARGAEPTVVLLNLAHRTVWGMESLDALDQVHHNALILVLDPWSVAEVPLLARELGATLVWSGVVVPPRVETLCRRWLALIEARAPAGNAARQPTTRRSAIPVPHASFPPSMKDV